MTTADIKMDLSNVKNYVKDFTFLVIGFISTDTMAMISNGFGIATAVLVFLTAFIRFWRTYKGKNKNDDTE